MVSAMTVIRFTLATEGFLRLLVLSGLRGTSYGVVALSAEVM